MNHEEIIRHLNYLSGDLRANVKAIIAFRLQISYRTLYMRLKHGFLPHEEETVIRTLAEYLDVPVKE